MCRWLAARRCRLGEGRSRPLPITAAGLVAGHGAAVAARAGDMKLDVHRVAGTSQVKSLTYILIFKDKTLQDPGLGYTHVDAAVSCSSALEQTLDRHLEATQALPAPSSIPPRVGSRDLAGAALDAHSPLLEARAGPALVGSEGEGVAWVETLVAQTSREGKLESQSSTWAPTP